MAARAMSVGDAVVVLLSAASPRLVLEEKLRASLRRLVCRPGLSLESRAAHGPCGGSRASPAGAACLTSTAEERAALLRYSCTDARRSRDSRRPAPARRVVLVVIGCL